MKRILLLVLVFLCSISILQGQNTCTDQLRIAQRNFDEGLLDDIPLLLEDCMKNGFTDEEKTNAYKLLIQTYIFTEQAEEADKLMMQFLIEFPSYKIAVNDPKEFIDLYSTYRTEAIYNIEISLGATLGIPAVTQTYSVADINSSTKEYSPGIGFSGEVNYLNKLKGNFNYAAGISFAYSRLGYYHEPYTWSTVEATFNSMQIGIPLSVRYRYNFGGIEVFAKAGLEPQYLILYNVDITRTDAIVGREPITETSPPKLASGHKKFDIRPLLGAGVKINLGRDELLVSLGYKFGFIRHLNEDLLYQNQDLWNKYLFVEDNMLINHASLNLSYIRPIYNPKKIR